ncbi:DUF2514 family protein [Escherichia coli]|nr:DUF2514 family protein [Escherichia coli]
MSLAMRGFFMSAANAHLTRNQQLAAEADRRRIAGLACERAYETMKGPKK